MSSVDRIRRATPRTDDLRPFAIIESDSAICFFSLFLIRGSASKGWSSVHESDSEVLLLPESLRPEARVLISFLQIGELHQRVCFVSGM